MKNIHLLTIIGTLTAALGVAAQVPSIINYQGRLSSGGTNLFNGTGQFKFALVNGGTNLNWQATAVATVSGGYLTIIIVTDGGQGYAETPAVTITDATGSNAVALAHISGGVVTNITVPNPGRNYSPSPTVTIAPPPPHYAYVTYWGNDGSGTGGGEPAEAVPLLVNQGLFSVNLGDTGLSNMTAVIPPSIFTNSDVRLRIWFSDGISAFQQFYPDQRLTSAGYAMMAANVADAAITSAKLAPEAVSINAVAVNAIGTPNITDGAITINKLAPELRQLPPIGSVTAWLKGFPSTPALPPGWVECNGQTLNDPQSPYNGQAIPNLNGFGGSTQRFLRGSTSSGAVGGEDMHTLTVQEIPNHTHAVWHTAPSPGSGTNPGPAGGYYHNENLEQTGSVGGGQAHETRPPFYEVSWIMRVK